MLNVTAPNCNSLSHITLNINFVISLQTVISGLISGLPWRMGRSHLGLGVITALVKTLIGWLWSSAVLIDKQGSQYKILTESWKSPMFFKRWYYKKWGCNVCKTESHLCAFHIGNPSPMLICQLLIFEFLGPLVLSFGLGETTPVSTVLSSWTHAWLASA